MSTHNNPKKERIFRILFTLVTLLAVIMALQGAYYTFIAYPPGNDECAWRALPPSKGKGLLIEQIVPGGAADRAGLKNGDILLRFNNVKITSSLHAMRLLDAVPRDAKVPYTVMRDGRILEVQVEIRKLLNIVPLAMSILGFGFMAVGYITILIKPTGFIQHRFWLYSLSTMSLFTMPNVTVYNKDLSYIFAYQAQYGWAAALQIYGFDFFNWIYYGTITILCLPTLVSFFFDFPTRRINKSLRKVIVFALFTSSALKAFAAAGFFGTSIITQAFINLFSLYSYFVLGLVIFLVSYFIETSPKKQRPLRPILFSVTLGLALMAYFIVVSMLRPFAVFLTPYLFLPTLLIIVVPFAFGYSIFRYGLMDFDLVLRRSLVYGGVTTSLAAVYFAIIFAASSLAKLAFGIAENMWLSVFALVAAAFALDPIKRRAQSTVDRIFFREQLNYRRILTDSAKELHHIANIADAVRTAARRIETAMHTEKVTVSFYGREALPATSELPDVLLELPQDILQSLDDKPLNTARAETEPETKNSVLRELLAANGVELLVPLIAQNTIIGSLNVGRKMNGKPFSGDDVELLSTVAAQAATAIENSRLREAEKRNFKLQEELATARNIQQGLLPEFDPHPTGFEITGVSIPAQVVGGDYFDYIRISENQWLIIIADVSGKGMPAALYMAKFQGMMQVAARQFDSPRNVLAYLNDMLLEVGDKRMFISVAAALLTISDKTLTICRAGHTMPILRRKNSTEFLRPSGLALGLTKGNKFIASLEEITVRLENNDVIAFYTDGVTETHDGNGREFGDENIRIILCNHESDSAIELKATLLDEINRFRNGAEQHDDTTVVIVKAI
ncbi:hypothetical protein MASR2M18_10930 [Ignavibacteria bacterium]|nr:SpoIIE family protein phosphatase [Bacteroidota bacterium]MCZ2132442.1 SpoIIE family protein phosphatase [Bacteroidota bacterium]